MYLQTEGSNFIQTYGALILSIFAIIQVWVIALYKRLKRGKILIFKTGWIEVGFGVFGPLITLTGTFRAQRKDVFIQEAALHLTRVSDGATFALDWLAFKSPQIKIGDPTATTFEIPSALNVRVDQPTRYSIVFCDKKIYAQNIRRLTPIPQEWKQFIVENGEKIQRALKRGGTTEDALAEQYFTGFLETSEAAQSALKLQESTNWLESGMYRIKIAVKALSPDRTYSEEWMFSLDNELSEGLRGNSLATLRDICLTKIEYFTANLEYIKEESR